MVAILKGNACPILGQAMTIPKLPKLRRWKLVYSLWQGKIMVIDRRVAAEALTSARETFDRAKEVAERRQQDLAAKLAAAAPSGEDINTALTNLSSATDAQLSQATASAISAAAAGIQAAANLLDAATPPAASTGKALDEWKECRATIDRCDKLLVDLRKTGFGFITAVVGASAYFLGGNSEHATNVAKSSLLVILVVLIIVLYLVDLAHQTWLGVAVKRANELERKPELNFELTQKISEGYAASQAVVLGCVLYSLVLFASCAIFWASIPLKAEDMFSAPRSNIYGAFLVGLLVIILALLVPTRREPTRAIAFVGVVFVVVVVAGLKFAGILHL
jgi:hypothetical protein